MVVVQSIQRVNDSQSYLSAYVGYYSPCLLHFSTKGVIIKSAEDVSIESATNVEIKATTINIDGDVNITGTLTASDDVVTGTISLKTHVHGGVTTGTETTLGPVP